MLSLDEQMKSDRLKALTNRERMLRWMLIILISVIVLGALYVGIHFLEGR